MYMPLLWLDINTALLFFKDTTLTLVKRFARTKRALELLLCMYSSWIKLSYIKGEIGGGVSADGDNKLLSVHAS